MNKDLEKVTEKAVETIIVAPVSIAVGAIKGVGSSIKKLTDWM